jgi:group I intron endonuclease
MIIYKITNTINGKFYIGQTTRNIKLRWYEHCHGSGCGIKLRHAINKYGKNAFIIEIVQNCSSLDELNKAEQTWIKDLNAIDSGYNLESGGKNKVPCLETRQKMSRSHKIAQNKPERLEQISKTMRSLWQNEEYKASQSKSRKGIPKSLEWKKKAVARTKKLAIDQLDLNGNTIKTFDSAVDVKRALGFPTSNIIACCKGRIKTAYSYMWKYSV